MDVSYEVKGYDDDGDSIIVDDDQQQTKMREVRGGGSMRKSTTATMSSFARIAVASILGVVALSLVFSSSRPSASPPASPQTASLLAATGGTASGTTFIVSPTTSTRRKGAAPATIVFSDYQDDVISQKQRKDLFEEQRGASREEGGLTLIVMDRDQQREFLSTREACRGGGGAGGGGVSAAVSRFDDFLRLGRPRLATELWKYCALYSALNEQEEASVRGGGRRREGELGSAVAYLDTSNPLVVQFSEILEGSSYGKSNSNSKRRSVAILGDSYLPQTIHGSLLVLQRDQIHVAKVMTELLLQTSIDAFLAADDNDAAVTIPRALYGVIAASLGVRDLTGSNGGGGAKTASSSPWYLLEEECSVTPLSRSNGTSKTVAASGSAKSWMDANSYRLHHHCPEKGGFCCSVYDSKSGHVVQALRDPIHPLAEKTSTTSVSGGSGSSGSPPSLQRRPYNPQAGHYNADELPYMATVSVVKAQQSHARPKSRGLFEELLRNDCLPTEKCNDCLKESKDGEQGCDACSDECSCYCRTLCQFQSTPTFISKRLTVSTPHFSRDSSCDGGGNDATTRLVPPIVHQLTPDDFTREDADLFYPDLSRSTQSFRLSGWEYRFYTERDVRAFFLTHFPGELLEAYEDIIPRNVKLDLFRYAVLLIHGGVFANVDMILESSLNSAIQPDVGFMVPIDNETEGCLWPGFIAAAPGHPFIAKAIENMVNQVRNRYTLVDIDYALCPTPSLSDTRTEKLFAYSSCLLAKSVNSVLNRPLQTPFEPGNVKVQKTKTPQLQELPKFPGRVVILNGDRNDMGGHRLTSTERNLIVAQADLEVLEDLSENNSTQEALGGPYDFEALYVDSVRANEDIRVYVDVPW